MSTNHQKDHMLGGEWEDEDEIENHPPFLDEKKRLFLFFSSLGVGTLILSVLFVWYLINPRLQEIGFYLDTITMLIFSGFIIVVFLNHFFLMLTAIIEKNLTPFNLRNSFVESYLFMFAIRIGKVFGISKDRIGNSFVKVNNALVKARANKIPVRRLLVLLPRCMQNNNCTQDILDDINNCIDCGKCNVTDFKRLSNLYDFYAYVATGGTLARKKIKEYRPSAILAVACERELVSGIGDIGVIPVIGITNERFDGPCKNTTANIEKIEEMVKLLKEKQKKTEENLPKKEKVLSA